MSEELPESTDRGTGVPEVDAAIAAVDELESLPVDEHVAVFERVQEQLRRALDASS